MPPQPTDTPTDTAALEQELAESRQFLARGKRAAVPVLVATGVFAGVTLGLLGMIRDVEGMRILTSATLLIGIIVVPLSLGAWGRAEYVRYRIVAVQLMLYGTPRQQADLIPLRRTMFRWMLVLIVLFGLPLAGNFVNGVLRIFDLPVWEQLVLEAAFGPLEEPHFYERLSCFINLGLILPTMINVLIHVMQLGKRLKPVLEQFDAAEKTATPPAPIDTAALKRRLIGARRSETRLKWGVAFIVFAFALGSCLSFVYDSAALLKFTVILTMLLAPAIRGRWEQIKHQIGCTQLLLYGTSQQQADLLPRYRIVFELKLIAGVIFMTYVFQLGFDVAGLPNLAESASMTPGQPISYLGYLFLIAMSLMLVVLPAALIGIVSLEQSLTSAQREFDEIEKQGAQSRVVTSPGGGQHARSAD